MKRTNYRDKNGFKWSWGKMLHGKFILKYSSTWVNLMQGFPKFFMNVPLKQLQKLTVPLQQKIYRCLRKNLYYNTTRTMYCIYDVFV